MTKKNAWLSTVALVFMLLVSTGCTPGTADVSVAVDAVTIVSAYSLDAAAGRCVGVQANVRSQNIDAHCRGSDAHAPARAAVNLYPIRGSPGLKAWAGVGDHFKAMRGAADVEARASRGIRLDRKGGAVNLDARAG